MTYKVYFILFYLFFYFIIRLENLLILKIKLKKMFTTTKILNKSEKLKSSLTQIEQSDIEKINIIIEKIKQNPDSYNFLFPVDTSKITDYLRVIKDRPMDITTIETKLKQKRYHFIQDIVDDFQLIWDNCRIYNREDSLIYAQAERMDKFCKETFNSYYHIQQNEKKNFVSEYNNNVYDEEAFNNPNYYNEGGSPIEPYFQNIKNKIILARAIKSLNPVQMKYLIENCNSIKPYITTDDDKSKNYNIHIENMIIEDLDKIYLFVHNIINGSKKE